MEARKERLVSASAKEERKKKEESLPALELYSLCKLYLEQSQNKDIFGQTKKNDHTKCPYRQRKATGNHWNIC